MRKQRKTVKESIATWAMFIGVAGVMFMAVMVAIDNAYSSVESFAELHSEREKSLE